jgi:hypothetical protein
LIDFDSLFSLQPARVREQDFGSKWQEHIRKVAHISGSKACKIQDPSNDHCDRATAWPLRWEAKVNPAFGRLWVIAFVLVVPAAEAGWVALLGYAVVFLFSRASRRGTYVRRWLSPRSCFATAMPSPLAMPWFARFGQEAMQIEPLGRPGDVEKLPRRAQGWPAQRQTSRSERALAGNRNDLGGLVLGAFPCHRFSRAVRGPVPWMLARHDKLLAGDDNPTRWQSSIWVTMNERSFSKTVRTPVNVALERQTSHTSHMKAMQSAKIRELRPALVDAGVLTLDQQAESLGLGRSTAWAVLKGNHKSSGLSTTLINRMLASPPLPGSARKIILEYVGEKSAGAYGHSKERLRQFRARLAKGQSFDAAEEASRVAD